MKNILTSISQVFGVKKPSSEEDGYSEYDDIYGGILIYDKAEDILRQEKIIPNLEWFIGHSTGINVRFFDESVSQYAASNSYHWVTFYVNQLKFRVERSRDESEPGQRIDETTCSNWHITVKVNDEIFLRLPYEFRVLGREPVQIIRNYKTVEIKLKRDWIKALGIFLQSAKLAHAKTKEKTQEWLDQTRKETLKKAFDPPKENIDLGDYE